MEKDKEQKELDEILAKEIPDLFLKLKEHELEFSSSSAKPAYYVSESAKVFLLTLLIDVVSAWLLLALDRSPRVLGIPWLLAFLDGFLFVGYGWIVIKRRRGEIDFSASSRGRLETKELRGESAKVLGALYIVFGLLLIGAGMIKMHIVGILP